MWHSDATHVHELLKLCFSERLASRLSSLAQTVNLSGIFEELGQKHVQKLECRDCCSTISAGRQHGICEGLE